MRNLEEVDWSKIPSPDDDGGGDHLLGMNMPSITLSATSGSSVNISILDGLSVVYIYPRTGRPDQDLPNGWDMIPGARGCTPQSCAFRDHFSEIQKAGATYLFGLSVQTSDYQQEAVERMHLPFQLLSDINFEFAHALKLPTFEADGMLLLKRMTLIIHRAKIIQVFFPVFPPDRNAQNVISWLAQNHSTL